MMFLVFKITSLIYLLLSSYFWPALFIPSTPILILTNVIMVLYLIAANDVKLRITARFIFICFLLLSISIWYGVISGIIYGIVMFLSFIPAVYLYILPVHRKQALLYFVTKWLAILIGISMIVFALVLLLNLTPPLGILIADGFNYPPYLNYFIYIKSTDAFSIFPRFNAFFLEPGHLAVICSFLLMANQFNFKKNKYCYILLLSVIMSFSVAGYVLLGVSYALLTIRNIRTLLGITIFGGILFLGAQLWDNGDNVLNELVFSRLQYDEDKGISGNNRTTPETDELFEQMIENGEIIIGIDNKEDIRIRGAGYKIFLIRYGVITTILIFCFYFALIPKSANKKYAYIFLFIIMLCFLQRAYPWWYSWLLPFALGVGIVRKHTKLSLRRMKLQVNDKTSRKRPILTYGIAKG